MDDRGGRHELRQAPVTGAMLERGSEMGVPAMFMVEP